jgi:biotin transporter BioY
MGYLIAFVIWTTVVGAFCYKVGFNYGRADGFNSARLSIYGS